MATGSFTTLSSGTAVFALTRATAPVPRCFAAIPHTAGAPRTMASRRASSAESGWSAVGVASGSVSRAGSGGYALTRRKASHVPANTSPIATMIARRLTAAVSWEDGARCNHIGDRARPDATHRAVLAGHSRRRPGGLTDGFGDCYFAQMRRRVQGADLLRQSSLAALLGSLILPGTTAAREIIVAR